MSLTIQRVTVPQRKRLSELGYTNDDIKDLQQNPQKLNQIIENGTVKTGATDLAIKRQQAKDLRIKTKATRTRDANQEHVTNWLAKLKKQGISISEATLREAIQSGDVQKFLGSKGISAGGGDTTIPWGVIKSMENVINYETKYDSKQDKPKVEVKKGNTQEDIDKWDLISKVQSKLEINNSDSNKSRIMIGNQKGENKQPADTSPFTYFA